MPSVKARTSNFAWMLPARSPTPKPRVSSRDRIPSLVKATPVFFLQEPLVAGKISSHLRQPIGQFGDGGTVETRDASASSGFMGEVIADLVEEHLPVIGFGEEGDDISFPARLFLAFGD